VYRYNNSVFDVDTIIRTGGLLAIAAIVFAESGILIGLVLPGDSLLIAAGLFAADGKLPIEWLIPIVIVAAIVGYEVGYVFGERVGPKIFKRKGGFLFREEYMGRTEKFFEKYGAITVLGARFIAHVRTLVSVIAGASHMDRRKYTFFNIVGAILWGGGLTFLSYWLGTRVSNIDRYVIPVVLASLIILYSFTIWKLAQTPEKRRNLKKGLKEDWDYFVRHKEN
jgi:membrane-associated protein